MRTTPYYPPRSFDSDDEASKFGSQGGYWLKYDRLADKFDQDMLISLNSNLDVLLIFAGLFSGIVTAFITSVVTPGSAERLPNYVRQSCMFYASLSCSLLAAAAAVLAKQWLQSYERTGQTGTREMQSIRRTEKFLGAKAWGLQPLVEVLPMLLLISLAIFFTALIDYLFQEITAAAVVVTMFASSGAAIYSLTVIVGAISTVSPFQTAVSTGLREVYNLLRDSIYPENLLNNRPPPYTLLDPTKASLCTGVERIRSTIDKIKQSLFQGLHGSRFHERNSRPRITLSKIAGLPLLCFMVLLHTVWMIIASLIILLVCLFVQPKRKTETSNIHRLHAHSAIWMIETAPERDNIITAAKNIPNIADFEAMKLIAPTSAFSLLLSQFRTTLQTIQYDRSTTTLADAVILSRCVASVVLADPEHSIQAVRRACGTGMGDWDPRELEGVETEGAEALKFLLSTIIELLHQFDSSGGTSDHLAVTRARLKFSWQQRPNNMDVAIYLRRCIFSGGDIDHVRAESLASEISGILLSENIKVDRTILSCASRALSILLQHFGPGRPRRRSEDEMAQTAWVTPISVASNVLDALDSFNDYYGGIAAQSRDNYQDSLLSEFLSDKIYSPFLRCHKQLLIHLQASYPSIDTFLVEDGRPSPQVFQRMHFTLNSNLEHLTSCGLKHVLPADTKLLRDCKDELAKVLEGLLRITGSRWGYVDWGALRNTARIVSHIYPNNDQLLQNLLYRAYIHVLRASIERHGWDVGAISNYALTINLSSALRLYRWLYPNTPAGEAWSTFGTFLRSMYPRQKFGVRGIQDPSPRHADPEVDSEIGEALIAMSREGALRYDGMAACLLWLAESVHYDLGGRWAGSLDSAKVIGLFIEALGVTTKELNSSLRTSGRSDALAAGLLFLRCWKKATIDPADWASTSVIEAFKAWIRTWDGRAWVEIEYENLVFARAQVPPDDIITFILRALEVNPQAAIEYGLEEDATRLLHLLRRHPQNSMDESARSTLNGWEREIELAVTKARSLEGVPVYS
ncbi:hypothetical protein FRB95_009515 [Tulasnella sp. JGI-2019a]|nr:hypothetical protein FRB95_009515 [Tulasnella sp. JGI-2019a]